jgi:uncharacterized protein (DUF1800 family)
VKLDDFMIEQNQLYRKNALGNYKQLITAIIHDPAMLRYLDGDTSLKDHPNENFGRELLELFTLGIGNYSESDIQQVARLFTGWGIRYLIYEGGGEQVQSRIKDSILAHDPMAVACFSPELHDPTPISALGITASSAQEFLEKLALLPKTAELITGKLWDYFAAVPASPQTSLRLVRTFLDNKGRIGPVLRAIAAEDDFWKPECVMHRVKSPADFVVPIVRQLGIGPYLLLSVGQQKAGHPLPKPLRDVGGLILGMMNQQGMLLLFPPDVGGWIWGTA